MVNKRVNLDQDIDEYFEFEINKSAYRMRYPTVEETDEIRNNATDEMKTRDLLFKYITPIDEKSPPIKEFYKTLKINQWNKFIGLILEKLRE